MASETKWMIRHKESKLLMQLERNNVDWWTHEESIATKFDTRAEAIKIAKKVGLNKNEYAIE